MLISELNNKQDTKKCFCEWKKTKNFRRKFEFFIFPIPRNKVLYVLFKHFNLQRHLKTNFFQKFRAIIDTHQRKLLFETIKFEVLITWSFHLRNEKFLYCDHDVYSFIDSIKRFEKWYEKQTRKTNIFEKA